MDQIKIGEFLKSLRKEKIYLNKKLLIVCMYPKQRYQDGKQEFRSDKELI